MEQSSNVFQLAAISGTKMANLGICVLHLLAALVHYLQASIDCSEALGFVFGQPVYS